MGGGGERVFKVTVKIFPELMKTINAQIQEWNNPKHRNMKKTVSKHITIKLLSTSDGYYQYVFSLITYTS